MPLTIPLTIVSTCVYSTLTQWTDNKEPPDHQQLAPGTTVTYMGHVPGGMVRVLHNGEVVIIHPGATKELK